MLFPAISGISVLYVQSIYRDEPKAAIPGFCLCAQNMFLLRKKGRGGGTSFLLLLFEAQPIVTRMFGLSFCHVVPSEMPQRSVTGEDLLAKSCFYQSNEPEEDGN